MEQVVPLGCGSPQSQQETPGSHSPGLTGMASTIPSSRITPVWGIQIPDARCLIYGLINKWGIMPSLSNTFGRMMLSKSHY